MRPSQKPANESKEINSKEAKSKSENSNEDFVVRSPANIFLINKELNPMFGVPKEKSHDSVLNAPVKESNFKNELQKNAAGKNVPENNFNEEKLKSIDEKDVKPKMKRSVRRTGLMGGGFNFVKDAMKSKKDKKEKK